MAGRPQSDCSEPMAIPSWRPLLLAPTCPLGASKFEFASEFVASHLAPSAGGCYSCWPEAASTRRLASALALAPGALNPHCPFEILAAPIGLIGRPFACESIAAAAAAAQLVAGQPVGSLAQVAHWKLAPAQASPQPSLAVAVAADCCRWAIWPLAAAAWESGSACRRASWS